jgi:hypothetical protein
MNTGYLLLCITLPIAVSLFLSRISANRLRQNTMMTISTRTLTIFLVSRMIYWIGFGILIAAFLLAILESGSGGEQTRSLIARSINTGDRTAEFILSDLSNYLLPIIFLSLFVAVFALGVIGRKVVVLLPEDGKPGIEFSRFRFTFVVLALSLIFPPLLFGSLLLL